MKIKLSIIILAILLAGCNKDPVWATEEPNWDKLVPIVIQIESSGNPNTISQDGCLGLMQISPAVFKEFYDMACIALGRKMVYQPTELFDPEFNKIVGTWYLRRIWFHYLPHYKLEQTLQNLCYAYNMGIGNLVKYRQGKIKLPNETKNYWLKYHKLAKGKK